MRIAIVAPPWLPVPPPAYGGTEEVIDWLARGLQDAGHDVLLFTTGDSTCPVPKAWSREESAFDQIGQTSIEMTHVLDAYDQAGDFEIIHDHTLFGPVYAPCRANGIVVATNHGPFLGELDNIYRRAARHAAVIGISHDQASRSSVPVSAVIHHGLVLSDFPIGAGDGGYFLFLGRLHPDKGAHEAAIAAHRAGVELLIAAKMREPEEHRYFKEQLEPLLDSSVRYLGEVNRKEKVELLRSARALLNPISWPEPFGLVMIESLACGTPVIAYSSGAAPEIIEHGENGFLCRNRSQLITAIQRVGDLDRARCRRTAATNFSAERMVADHAALYQRLIDDRAKSVASPRAEFRRIALLLGIRAVPAPVLAAGPPLQQSEGRHHEEPALRVLVPHGAAPGWPRCGRSRICARFG